MRQWVRASVHCMLWVCLLALLGGGPAWAHKGSDAYLDVQQQAAASPPDPAMPRAVQFTLAVAIRDLDLLVPMDADSDARVTWGEIRAAMPQVLAVANQGVRLDAPDAPAAACALQWQFAGIERRGDGAYVRLEARAACPPTQGLALRYTLLAEQDANHRLLVSGRLGGKDVLTTTSPLRGDPVPLLAAATAAAQATAGSAAGDGAAPASRWETVRAYFLLGIHHLLEGYDHLAFLLALVLPLRLALFPAAGRSDPRDRRW